MLKPVTVISGSSPRVAVETPVRADAGASPDAGRAVADGRGWWPVPSRCWSVGLVLFLNAGDDDPPSSTTPTPTDSHPDALDPLAPTEPPDVTGRRTAQGVVFRWAAPDGAQTGDSWQWRRTDTGEERAHHGHLAATGSAAGDRVCLQVRLIRGGFASPWGNRCVD